MPTDIDTTIERVTAYSLGADTEMLRRAYEFAEKAHAGQERLTGDPYISHPLAVANILAEIQADPVAVAAALLHDTVEDTGVAIADIEQQFGERVAHLVAGVTKLTQLDFSSRQDKQAQNLRKMFLAMADDIGVILIKLADRLHNMRTLEPLEAEDRQRSARETLHIFAPLAHRLGISQINWELEDLALKHLEGEAYWDIVEKLGQSREARVAQLNSVQHQLQEALDEAGVPAEIEGRAKHIYSIYEKMKEQQIDFGQIADLTALRVITDTVDHCYAALGVVHSLWIPVAGMFADHIATPKSNKYRSLHTKVFGPDKQPMEIQIRTEQMHQQAEYGVAAHWRYKEEDSDPQLDEQISWLRQMLDLETDLEESHEFLELLELDLFQDQVFVFTPDGDVVDLPGGAGPIDFAYRIHSEVGDHCSGARVNGRMVPLDYSFQNGDIVEIITSSSAQPSRDWLRIIKSSRAKAKVRKFLRLQTEEENIRNGRQRLAEVFAKSRELASKTLDEKLLTPIAEHLNYPDVDSLLAAIGYGEVGSGTVANHLIEGLDRRPRTLTEEVELSLPETPAAPPADETMLVSIEGIRGLECRLARCCNPLPGDEITGYVTRGSGISVHRTACKNLQYLQAKDPERLVSLEWATSDSDARFRTRLEIIASDRVGLLSHITAIVSDCDINIVAAQVNAEGREFARLLLTLDIASRRDLDRLMDRLKKLIDVISVRQVPAAEEASE